MKSIARYFTITYSCAWAIAIAIALPTSAQILPDATLPNNSTVNIEGQINRITGGTTAGNNLFHSFKEFSIPTGNSAYFDNAVNIQNIFSRVTGSSISNIDGLIRANGNANLFLLNPNGIVFGPNARLNIGGSFLGTTANSIIFSDKVAFSARNTQNNALLTVNVPIGLQFGNNPGAIRVIGTGHSLTRSNPVFGQTMRGKLATSLQVQSRQTIALLGGDIFLEGANLIVEGGRIELGSIGEGFVRLNPKATGWNFSYEQVPIFRDIQLSQLSSLDASGDGGGYIFVQGRRVSLRDGSVILVQNFGSQPGGELNINGSEEVNIIGTAPDLRIRTNILNQTVGAGSGGSLSVNTRRLVVRDGGAIYTATFNSGQAGNLNLNASESVKISGFSARNPSFFSLVSAPTYSSGQGGSVTITTGRLSLLAGGAVASSTFGSGKAGNLTVQATDAVELMGKEPRFNQSSALVSSTFNAGDAGNLIINTSRLIVKDGSTVNATTFATGNAGNVSINATDFVELSGIESNSSSSILSSAETSDRVTQELFRVPAIASGSSGDVTVNAGRVILADSGGISTSNAGPRNAGTLRVNANSILLNHGFIAAATASGEGGNIILEGQNLQLRNQSLIITTALGSGNGGNVTINAGAIAIIEKSAIAANAIRGRGGNIQIATQGLFQSSDSAITATSLFGISGQVQLSTPDINPSAGLVQLPANTVDATALIGRDPCRLGSDSSFTITGKGGLPSSPEESLSSPATVVDWAAFDRRGEGAREHRRERARESSPSTNDRLVEATGWTLGPDGNVILTTNDLNSEYSPGLINPGCHPSVPELNN